jgi:diguanylate cyclase (GGDEF)-like protein/PAS domain S-box-containing protein
MKRPRLGLIGPHRSEHIRSSLIVVTTIFTCNMAVGALLLGVSGRLPRLAKSLLLAMTEAVLAALFLYPFVVRPFIHSIAREMRRLSTILDAAPEAIFEVTPDGRIQSMNEEALNLFGYAREELTGQEIEMLLPPRFRKSHIPLRQQYVAHPHKRPMASGIDLTGFKKSGEEFPIEISLNTISDREFTTIICIVRDISPQKAAKLKIMEINERLTESLTAQKILSDTLAHLKEFSELLESCAALSEVYSIVAKMFDCLFPERSGTIYLTTASRTALERVTSWGPLGTPKPIIAIHECWALRRGKLQADGLTPCGACTARSDRPQDVETICVPMIAQGDMIGVLHLSTKRAGTDLPAIAPEPSSQPNAAVLAAAVERTSIAIANLRLREALRDQAVRDTLTGLFNRRFLEEYLEMELLRAMRNGRPLTVMMLDADHFKRFNDTFGHKAGDLVLQEIAGILRMLTRASDTACRFGGEELVVVCTETSLDDGIRRAEEVRQAIENLTVVDAGQRLGKVTVSIGVASAPEHGYGMVGLLHAADEALYAAKNAGRNRVVHATLPDVLSPSNTERPATEGITAVLNAVGFTSELDAKIPA